jgi:hypothetical protein
VLREFCSCCAIGQFARFGVKRLDSALREPLNPARIVGFPSRAAPDQEFAGRKAIMKILPVLRDEALSITEVTVPGNEPIAGYRRSVFIP